MKKICMLLVMAVMTSVIASAQIRYIDSDMLYNEIMPDYDRPIVLDFCASWCGPCQKYAPVMDKAKAFYGNQVEFYKVDVDENSDLCSQFNISSVPTTIIIYNSEGYYYQSTGLLTLAQLREGINKALKENR